MSANTGVGRQPGVDIEVVDLAGGVRLIALRTRLDIFGVERIGMRFRAAVSTPGGRTIVDLSRVDFIASIGLQMLLSAARLAREHQARFVLFGASKPVSEMFEHAAVGSVIGIADSEAAALEMITN
jgi:anti-anti-sigma factor